MLRAEAAEFCPAEVGNTAEYAAEFNKVLEKMTANGQLPEGFDGLAEEYPDLAMKLSAAAHELNAAWEELCSTAAPSPALTAVAASPMFSPYWGMTEEWAGHPAFGTDYSQTLGLPEADQFALPESAEGEVDPIRISPAYIAGGEDGGPCFVLTGMEDLQSNLASLLSNHISKTEEEEGMQCPPGLELPPGLEHMAGNDGESVGSPPGLATKDKKKSNGATTVAELHAKLNKKGKAKAIEADADEDDDKDVQATSAGVLPPGCVTAMLRNIPNKYTQLMLMEQLYDDGFKGELDFIYLPIDFKNKCNVGYAFLNFRTPEACAAFAAAYHLSNTREKLPGFNSKKVCEVSAARFQGRQENVRRLQASAVMAELSGHPDWLPMLFDEDGKAVEFPVPEDAPKDISMRSGRGGRLSRRGRTQS